MNDGHDGIDPLPVDDAATDGSVGAISQQAPRAMKQPRKDVLRDALRNAADRIEAVSRERDAWRDLAEREPEEATPFPAAFLLAIGWIVGAACMALAGWAL